MSENSSFVRWQGVTIAQLGYAINLLLGMAVGMLAFSTHLLLDRGLLSNSVPRGLMIGASMILLASVFFGLLSVVSRLRDFRITSRVARNREKNGPMDERQDLRLRSRSLGRWTWTFFWVQTATFGIGSGLLVVAVLIQVVQS